MEYLLKSVICLMVFLAIHRLLLQREVFYQFNRFFLLGAVLFSFLIPLNTIENVVLVERQVPVLEESFDFEENFIPTIETESNLETTYIESQSEFPWETLVWTLYGLISLVFLIRFIKNISILYDQVRRNLKVTYRGQTLVLLSQKVIPYTFFQYIFVTREEFENEEISDSVIEHELAHVKGKHSWDILFIELLMIPFWFHPGLYWAKQSIMLNHEFIADQSALKKWPLHQYQSELLRYATFQSQNSLVSNLNFSLTKKRLEMMKKNTKPTIQAIKLLVLVPVLGMVIYGFSEKKSVEVEKDSETESKSNENSEELDFHLNIGGGIKYEGKVYAISDLKDLLKDSDNTVVINLSVDPGVPMGQLADFQTKLRELDVRKIKYVSNSGIWPPSNERMNDLTEYLNGLQVYKERLATGVHYIQRSADEQKEILNEFLDLGGKYFRLPMDLQSKTQRPKHPYDPFIRLEKDGEVYFKEPGDLTAEEKATLPAPPPHEGMADETLLEAYNELFYSYELKRNEKQHFIFKSENQQADIKDLYDQVMNSYMSLDYLAKRRVTRPTLPSEPYVKITRNGVEMFKLPSELTPEERAANGC
ncbi:M56 family metallopeptidase [Algoriphagus sp. PAP.12]|uniref:M56 family metallopeptidase n=1 Tax=Algoriphagus sp. PAP.12 TaxID=2996678 RepID=UPI00227C6846|nr:M56 family metallopeptidase [Algoriphagus sp. PAP.12]